MDTHFKLYEAEALKIYQFEHLESQSVKISFPLKRDGRSKFGISILKKALNICSMERQTK